VSDDGDTWQAVGLLKNRNPLIGVLHADDAPYYELASRYREAAAALVAVSTRILNRAVSEFRGSCPATAVIPCGIPLPPESDAGAGESPALRLVWVGRISEPQKRVSDLAKIARVLRDAGVAFHLDIVGDGEAAPELQSAMQSARVAERVRFHGWIASHNVLAMLRSSDVMIMPSNFEGMPVAAMEALACGCAVVGSDTCGLEEYAHIPAARDAVWIYPRGHVEEASRLISAAGAVPREQRRAAARRLAESEFSIEQCLQRYQKVLESLPERAPANFSIGTWHPGDVVSRLISIARSCRAAVARVRVRGASSPQRIRPATA
jgi:glycosyltransferase involved in cell wall biosynthesis